MAKNMLTGSKMFRRTAWFILILIFISGCSTNPQLDEQIAVCSKEANAYTPGSRFRNSTYWNCLDREKNRQAAENAYQTQQALLQKLRIKCESYGFKSGTTEYSVCLQQAEQQESLNSAMQMQQEQARYLNSQENFRRASCVLSGKWDCP